MAGNNNRTNEKHISLITVEQVGRDNHLISLCSAHVNMFIGIISWNDFAQEEKILAEVICEKRIILFSK